MFQHVKSKFAAPLLLAAFTLLASGCASPPPGADADEIADFHQINDPLEPTNRVIFSVNESVDSYLMRPAAEGYRAVLPQFGRDRVNDFLDNLKGPLYFANDLAQGNLGQAWTSLCRLIFNTTFGVAGVMDVAAPMGFPGHQADFGQTLGVWGIGEGPYLVLPLFGPSNPRDALGLAAESLANGPDSYLQSNHMHWLAWVHTGLSGLALRESYLDSLDDVKRTSLDYYSAMRSLYRQRRESQIDQARTPQPRQTKGDKPGLDRAKPE